MFVGFGVEKHTDKIFMVTEYMSGGELADRLYRKDKRPSWDLRIKWLEDVSAGLMYLHYTHRSVHRDVKSGNILLTDHSENARAKLGGMFFFFQNIIPITTNTTQTLDWRKLYTLAKSDFKLQRNSRVQCLNPIRRLCGNEE